MKMIFRIKLGSNFTVYNELGPGLLESVYEVVLAHILKEKGLDVKKQLSLPVYFEGIKLDGSYRIDLLINDLVVVEIRSVESVKSIHHLQLLTYLNFLA